MIDLYCERVNAEFWAEPINALTNFAFILVGLIGIFVLSSKSSFRKIINVLSILVIVIGVSSFAFHTLATRWAAALDSLSILVFALTFIGFFVRLVLRQSRISLIAWLLSVPALMFICELIGKEFGIPAASYLGFVVVAFALAFISKQPERNRIFTITLVFLLSFVFRTIDEPYCEHLRVGTHFIWHLLNAFVCYLCLRVFAKRDFEKT